MSCGKSLEDGGLAACWMRPGRPSLSAMHMATCKTPPPPGAARALGLERRPSALKATPCLASVLTRREGEVATRIAWGLSNRQIAADLVIARSTAERHVANILSKLAMRSRAQVAAWAVHSGLV